MITPKREVDIKDIERTPGVLKVNVNYRNGNYKCELYKNRFIKSERGLSDIDVTVVYKVDKELLKNIRTIERFFLVNDYCCFKYNDYIYDCWFSGTSSVVVKDSNIVTIVYKCKGDIYYPSKEEYISTIGKSGERVTIDGGNGTKVDISIHKDTMYESDKLHDFCLRIYDKEGRRLLNTISFKSEDFKGNVEILSSISQIRGIDIDKIHIDDFITSDIGGIGLSWDEGMDGYAMYISYRGRV